MKVSGNTRIVLSALGPALGLLCGAHAQPAPIVIKFSHVVTSDAPKGKAADYFKKLVEERTKGRVKVEVYPNSSLYKDKEELEALQLGSVGAIPQVMAFSDVYQGLQTGVVDGNENTPSNIYTQKMHEVQKYMTITDHGYIGYVVVANTKFWDSLPPDLRAILEQTMKEATDYADDIAKKENDDAVEAIRKSGRTQIIELTADQKRALKKAMLPVHRQMEDRVGRDAVQSIYKATGFDPASL